MPPSVEQQYLPIRFTTEIRHKHRENPDSLLYLSRPGDNGPETIFYGSLATFRANKVSKLRRYGQTEIYLHIKPGLHKKL